MPGSNPIADMHLVATTASVTALATIYATDYTSWEDRADRIMDFYKKVETALDGHLSVITARVVEDAREAFELAAVTNAGLLFIALHHDRDWEQIRAHFADRMRAILLHAVESMLEHQSEGKE